MVGMVIESKLCNILESIEILRLFLTTLCVNSSLFTLSLFALPTLIPSSFMFEAWKVKPGLFEQDRF